MRMMEMEEEGGFGGKGGLLLMIGMKGGGWIGLLGFWIKGGRGGWIGGCWRIIVCCKIIDLVYKN